MTETSDEAVPEQSEQLDLQPEEMLIDTGRNDDMLDGGYQVPDHWSAGQGFGNTVEEQAEGETLEQRLAQEVPDVGEEALGASSRESVDSGVDPVDSDVTSLDLVGEEDLDNVQDDVHASVAGGSLEALSAGDLDEDSDGDLFPGTETVDDGEVGDEQVVRLVGAGEDTDADDESELLGLDADDVDDQTAEEAAVHIVAES